MLRTQLNATTAVVTGWLPRLRHGTGFKLASDEVNFRALQAYMGHANPTNTMKYTRLAPTLFKGFWKD
jgi:integrase